MCLGATVQEHDLIRRYNEQAGNAWEVQNEDDESWNRMEVSTPEDWIDEGPPFTEAMGSLMDELHQTNEENIDINLGGWTR